MNTFTMLTGGACTVLACLGLASPASGAQKVVEYSLSVAGIPLGKAKLFYGITPDSYNFTTSVKITGLADWFVDGKGQLSTSGKIEVDKLVPVHFRADGKVNKTSYVIDMAYSNGMADTKTLVPPVKTDPRRVPVTAEHRKALDPLSAWMLPIAEGRSPFDPANCGMELAVFDGSSRHNLKMSFKEVKEVKTGGYKGKVLVCSVRYQPVSGHRPGREGVKFMEQNKDIYVWYAPLTATNLLVPAKIHVATGYGAAEAVLSRVKN
ncbi:MAG: DUF3108 domain-containing protein [Methylobacteriaceae bacterium]|nr:DUF3108 domain-containing protein [Methylobacteriaceae bacterium]